MARWLVLAVLVPCFAIPAAEDTSSVKDLLPRRVRIDNDVPLDEALRLLEEQTGNAVVDRRAHRSNPRLSLKLHDVVFWQALDEIVRQADCGYSPYQQDGKVALIDAPQRKTQVNYVGLYRFAVKRVAVTRDIDSGSHVCTASLELAWEPRLRPFLLHIGSMTAAFEGKTDDALVKVKAAPQGHIAVTGQQAAQIDVRFPAPTRTSSKIVSLEGNFALLAPTRMLEFAFAELRSGISLQQAKEGVAVAVKMSAPQERRWTFDVQIANPPGGPLLESYQEDVWLANNEIALRGMTAGKVKVVTPLESEREDLEITARKAHIRYHFTRDLPASPSGWSLVYRTPGRIALVPASFKLSDIPLP